MDTSEAYIKMCDCPKIQDNIPSRNMIHTFYDKLRNKSYQAWGREIEGHIWLPYQDEIQEMMEDWVDADGGTSIESIFLICQFAKFCGIHNQDAEGSSNVYIRKVSLEILWLAFYMYEIHKKIWDGEKWLSG